MSLARVAVLAALLAGIILAIAGGWSFAANPVGQVGYGNNAPPALEISSRHVASHTGWWIGLGVAVLVVAVAGAFGYRHRHDSSEYS